MELGLWFAFLMEKTSSVDSIYQNVIKTVASDVPQTNATQLAGRDECLLCFCK